MRRMAAVVMIAMLLSPGLALAGSSTDAALGLGAFAVFNQIISGTGVFGYSAVGQPTVIERQVVVAPPPPVVVAPQPVVVYQTPAPVYYTPARCTTRPTCSTCRSSTTCRLSRPGARRDTPSTGAAASPG